MFLNAVLIWVVPTSCYYFSATISSELQQKKERTEEKGDFKQLNPKGKEKIEVNDWQDMYENMSAEQHQWWGREKISCCHSVFPVDVGMESS